MVKKSITLDKLARMVQEGFLGVQGQLNEIKNESIAISSRLDAIENQLDTHDLMFESVMRELKEIRRELIGNQMDIRELDKRVNRLEKKVGIK